MWTSVLYCTEFQHIPWFLWICLLTSLAYQLDVRTSFWFNKSFGRLYFVFHVCFHLWCLYRCWNTVPSLGMEWLEPSRKFCFSWFCLFSKISTVCFKHPVWFLLFLNHRQSLFTLFINNLFDFIPQFLWLPSIRFRTSKFSLKMVGIQYSISYCGN